MKKIKKADNNMKVEIGDIIEIKGKQAIVCFETTFNNEKYICVAFEDKTIAYDMYKWRIQNEKLQVAKVTDNYELSNVLSVFLKESIDEDPNNNKLKDLIAKIAEKLKKNEG